MFKEATKTLHAELNYIGRDSYNLRKVLMFHLGIASSFLKARETDEDAIRVLRGLSEQLVSLLETAAVSGNGNFLASVVANLKDRLAKAISSRKLISAFPPRAG